MDRDRLRVERLAGRVEAMNGDARPAGLRIDPGERRGGATRARGRLDLELVADAGAGDDARRQRAVDVLQNDEAGAGAHAARADGHRFADVVDRADDVAVAREPAGADDAPLAPNREHLVVERKRRAAISCPTRSSTTGCGAPGTPVLHRERREAELEVGVERDGGPAAPVAASDRQRLVRWRRELERRGRRARPVRRARESLS